MIFTRIKHRQIPTLIARLSPESLGRPNQWGRHDPLLRQRRIPLLGLVLNGPLHPDNPRTLEELAGVPVLAELPPLEPLSDQGLQQQWRRLELAGRLERRFLALDSRVAR